MGSVIEAARLEERKTAYAYIRETLGIRDYMGDNLDALEDVLGGYEGEITIRGEASKGGYAEKIIAVFSDAAAENSGIKLTFEEKCVSQPVRAAEHMRYRAIMRAKTL